MSNRTFSFKEYKEIIRVLKKALPIIDFADVTDKISSFCVIRHDVEYSVDRAFDMARIDRDLGIQSSFFFQVNSIFYNILEQSNFNAIIDIMKMKHKIGLHIYVSDVDDEKLIRKIVVDNIGLLSNILGINIDRFSFHRPTETILKKNVYLNNLINAYQGHYFPANYIPYRKEDDDCRDVFYLSDSNQEWKFSYPSEALKKKPKKVQILIHPDYWTNDGSLGAKDTLESIIHDKIDGLRKSMKREDKTYRQ